MENNNEEKKSYEIIKDLGIIEEKNNQYAALREVAWFDKDPKLELRRWFRDENGDDRPTGKGITFMTENGANTLTETLVDRGYGDTSKLLLSISNRVETTDTIKETIKTNITSSLKSAINNILGW